MSGEQAVSTIWQPQQGPHFCQSCGEVHKWTIMHDGKTFCEHCDPWEIARRARKDERLTEVARTAFLVWAMDTHFVSESAADEVWREYADTRERWRKVVQVVVEEVGR